MNELANIGNTFLFLSKLGITLFLFLYVIFAVVVVRQVKIMTETLKVGFEIPIKAIALLHLIVALFVLVLSFFIL